MSDQDYRRDNRSLQEFAADIQHGHKVERDIIVRYVDWVKQHHGVELTIKDNGVDNTGQLIETATTDADYLLDGQPVEVKFNNHLLATFHIKVGQLRSYVRQGAAILWVNGYESSQPIFTVVSTRQLVDISRREVVEFVGWGGKKCYRIEADEFQWKNF